MPDVTGMIISRQARFTHGRAEKRRKFLSEILKGTDNLRLGVDTRIIWSLSVWTEFKW